MARKICNLFTFDRAADLAGMGLSPDQLPVLLKECSIAAELLGKDDRIRDAVRESRVRSSPFRRSLSTLLPFSPIFSATRWTAQYLAGYIPVFIK